MFLIDTHAHLDEQSFETEIDDLIQRAQAAAVKGIVTIGITLDSCRRAIALAEKYSAVRAAVGIHPQIAISIKIFWQFKNRHIGIPNLLMEWPPRRGRFLFCIVTKLLFVDLHLECANGHEYINRRNSFRL